MGGFPDLLKSMPSFLFLLVVWSTISIASLMSQSMFGGENFGVLELDVTVMV
jgi:hypothetical protein